MKNIRRYCFRILITISLSLIYIQPCKSQNDTIFSPFEQPVSWGKKITLNDFNNDGFLDMVVLGMNYINKKGEKTGIITIYPGSGKGFPKAPTLSFEGAFAGQAPGLTCCSGDFNNDGFDDLAVSNPFLGEPQLDRGYVQIFWGGKKGIQSNHSVIKKGGTCYGSFGSDIRCLDFNGDGIDDLLVVARFDKILEGRIYIYLGSDKFTIDNPNFELQVPNSESLYYSLTYDFNNDGCDDILCRSNSNWVANITQLYIFYGGVNVNNYADLNFQIENFAPRFVLRVSENDTSVLLIGTYYDINQLMHIKTLLFKNKQLNQLPFQLTGVPVAVDKNTSRIIVLEGEGQLELKSYFLNEQGSQFQKTIWKFRNEIYPNSIEFFTIMPGKTLKAIVQVKQDGKEFIVFKELD